MSGAHPAVAGRLAALDAAGLTRALRETETLAGCRVRVAGREAVSFGSCDYLGLAHDPVTAAAASQAALRHGSGSGAARLLTGHTPLAAELERELAAHFGAPAALVFGAGYLANLGVVTALASPGDLIASDRLNHRATIDACRLSGADVAVFAHDDAADLARRLAEGGPRAMRLVVVEGVWSMDGGAAPLAEMAAVCAAHDAVLVVDDAHGLGVRGPAGRGSLAAARAEAPHGSAAPAVVQIGNLGKALGSYGAFVLCDDEVRDLLVQRARSFVFTCALPPAVLGAARAGLAVLRDDPSRLARLHDNTARLRAALARRGVPVLGAGRDDVPIVPVPVPSGTRPGEARAVDLAARLLERGWLVPAIRPPTVAPDACRLRLTVTADHRPADLHGVAAALAEVLAEDGGG